MNYVITGSGFISPELKKLENNKKCTFIDASYLSSSTMVIALGDKVYVPTEEALQSVLEKMKDEKQKAILVTLKNKFACRQMLHSLYPLFFFKEVMLHDLSNAMFDKGKKYVVKPKLGFFNVGVRVFKGGDNMEKLQKSITMELAENAHYFSQEVLSSTELLVEEYIQGIEFAVDMYYSSEGKPIIINIYKHPVSKHKAYFHLVYYSQKLFFDKYLDRFLFIFETLNTYLHATSIPIHAEFKYVNGEFVPIEFNPMRYGGMGLADLTKYAYGFDPFLAFFENSIPDWKKIWDKRRDICYVWVLGYKGTKTNSTDRPNHKKFKKKLGNILHYNKLNYREMPVFANAYIATNKKKIKELLSIDFNEYFKK